MLKIHPDYLQKLAAAESAEELWPLVQEAIRLEHATIPPYLCAYFSLKLGSNQAVADIIRSVVNEEMLHMTIASNLLIALGGSPEINRPDFVPDYPGGLPFGIGDDLQIHLRQCSIDQVRDVFMKIEEPEHPIDIPTQKPAMMAVAQELEFPTIGAFYTFLEKKIIELQSSLFTRNRTKNQVIAPHWFPASELFAIDSAHSAVIALNVILDQGEGTSTDPFDQDGIPAHYYRFEEIVKGRKLILDNGKPVFGGAPVSFDPDSVWDMDDDPKAAKYREGSRSRHLADQFNYSYTMLLNALHQAFNGEPERINDAMGVMYELRFLAQQVLATPAEWSDPTNTANKQTGLSFEYQPLNQ